MSEFILIMTVWFTSYDRAEISFHRSYATLAACQGDGALFKAERESNAKAYDDRTPVVVSYECKREPVTSIQFATRPPNR